MSVSEIQTASISAAKAQILDQFDEGDITFREAFEKIDKLQRDEIDLLLQRERPPNAKRGMPKSVVLGLFLAALTGFFASPFIYPKLFGYKSAEQCVLDAKHQWAVSACYELYSSNATPSKPTTTKGQTTPTDLVVSLNANEPGRYSLITDPRELAELNDPNKYTPATATSEPLPTNGEVVWYGPAKVGVAPLEIKSQKGEHYLLKLTNATTNEDVMSIFIVGGNAVNTQVPLGQYVIKYAVGEQWYGYQKYFGPTTTYAKADSLFDFRKEGDFVDGHSITLYKVKGGNLRTSSLSAKDF